MKFFGKVRYYFNSLLIAHKERTQGHTSRRSGKHSRSYKGAAKSELLADWNVGQTSSDTEVRSALRTARSRSRDLERNNDYVNKFLYMNEANVIGQRGIQLISNVLTSSGKPDVRANEVIEDSWKRWGKLGICTVDGQYSWQSAQRQVARAVPRDGEMLVRILRGVDNPWGFAIQLIEPDHLDTDLDNLKLSNGNVIRMGVELDSFRRPVAYHIKADHPGDYAFFVSGRQTARIPASEMRLIFLPLRAESTRGFPWINTAMVRLKMIGAYDEAEVVAARYGASKMGVMTKTDGETSTDPNYDDTDSIGNPIEDIAPGVNQQLPPGWDYKLLDPTHPSKNYGEFNKAALRGVASGLNVSYVSLANNLEGVNFSSIRQGVIDERDQWRMVQMFYIERLHNWVYEEWLKMAMLTDMAGKLTPSKLPQYLKQGWQPRGWEWVNPLVDTKAKLAEIEGKINSRTRVCRERGHEFTDIVKELAAEDVIMQAAGVAVADVDAAIMNKSAEGDGAGGGTDDLKQSMDAYGVGVRSGAITPQATDEDHFRAQGGLPVKGNDVDAAWSADGGTRRPVTLQSGAAFEADQEEIVETTEGDSGAGDDTEEEGADDAD